MTDSVLTYLDGYCERAGDAALLAEPLNAVTNLFFILAAVLAARALYRFSEASNPPRKKWDPVMCILRIAEFIFPTLIFITPSDERPVSPYLDLKLLIFALFAIGVGSAIWHLHPNGGTVLLDVIPITMFIHIYLIASMRRLLGLRWGWVGLWWLLYFVASILAQLTLSPHLLNGTIMYIPTYLTLIILTAAVRAKDQAAGRIFIQMVLVWTASLIFRTVDLQICDILPIGTHFLWHTLNAYMLYRLLMVLVTHAKKSVA